MKKESKTMSKETDEFATPPEALDRAQRAQLIRTTRRDLGLSQNDFAERFRVPVGTLRDWEQARTSAPDFAVAYMRVIAQHADLVEQVLA